MSFDGVSEWCWFDVKAWCALSAISGANQRLSVLSPLLLLDQQPPITLLYFGAHRNRTCAITFICDRLIIFMTTNSCLADFRLLQIKNAHTQSHWSAFMLTFFITTNSCLEDFFTVIYSLHKKNRTLKSSASLVTQFYVLINIFMITKSLFGRYLCNDIHLKCECEVTLICLTDC